MPDVLTPTLFVYAHKKSPNQGAFFAKRKKLRAYCVVPVLDLVVLSLSVLEELSEAFLATRATAIAGQPVRDATTGIAINQHPIFTNLFIFFSPLKITM